MKARSTCDSPEEDRGQKTGLHDILGAGSLERLFAPCCRDSLMKDDYRKVSASPERGSELDRLSRLLGVARIDEKGESDRPDFQIDTAESGRLLNHLSSCLGIPRGCHNAPLRDSRVVALEDLSKHSSCGLFDKEIDGQI